MSQKLIFKNNSIDLINSYDHFILDVWGVIHDGTSAYDGVINNLTKLKEADKKMYFLSNAPRRASKVAITLEKFGVTKDFYEFIMTSGEATYAFLKENEDNNFNEFGKNYYYIGPNKDNDLLDGLNYNEVQQAKDASFAIVTGFDDASSKEDEKIEYLKECLKNNLKLICVNPDIIVIKQTGQEMLCAGLIAKQYQEMGGEVIYFGKPYEAVYKEIFSLSKNSDNSKFLVIGDGIETDIKGAISNNIDSALIGGGILSNKLNIKYGQLPKEDDMINICNDYNIYPKFILSGL